ncbi:tyrosine kinase receptor Cad96Ca-like [Amphiura filiformis]|uniref:tyrosine kinase receptor Cad96Ca-like n=1 Tax=Amphiura filiformis TaxID=82378 RepID=UPI003B20EC4E
MLGSGEFAVVYRAHARGIRPNEVETVVAVKVFKEMSADDKTNFRKEVDMHKSLYHPNIIKILRTCIEKDPYYIILEFASEGDLKSYLQKTRKDTNPAYMPSDQQPYPQVLTPKTIMTFAIQIARAMTYLASKKCVHRDLAARNILLADGLVCKLSDFGLARKTGENNFYEMKSQCRVPYRWMALESLLDNKYLVQSDVWSFGILLYELSTLGSDPYIRMSYSQVKSALNTGYRLPKPEHCSDEIYGIMRSCWERKPDDRPTIKQIQSELEHMLACAQGYLDLSEFNESEHPCLPPV